MGSLTHAILEGRHNLRSISRHVQGIGVDVENLPFLLFLPLQLQPAPLFCGQQPHSGGEVSLVIRDTSREARLFPPFLETGFHCEPLAGLELSL